VTFCDFADLTVQLNYPVKATPGQNLQSEVTIAIENKGSAAAKNIVLEIVLSKDNQIPFKKAAVSDKFSEDAFWATAGKPFPVGGRTAAHHEFQRRAENSDDTPPGKYYLG